MTEKYFNKIVDDIVKTNNIKDAAGINQAKELVKTYYHQAKIADQKLRRLESYSHDKYYKDIKRYAYVKAQEDIKIWSGGAATRFSTKPPKSLSDIRAKINDINRFLQSPTSSKKGVTDIYKKRTDTINKKYGTNLTWQQLSKYFESGQADKLGMAFGSETAIKIIGSVNKLAKKTKNIINDIKNVDEKIQFSEDEVLEKQIEKAINQYGKDLLL